MCYKRLIWKVEKIFKRHITGKHNIFTANEDSFPPVVKTLGLGITAMRIWKAETFGLYMLRIFYYHLYLGVRPHCRPILKLQ